ncbi:MAG: tetratricopeptide repeat protein, partial [Microbacteriaceae bacterium]
AINSGDYDAAIRAYHRALEANPKDQDAAAGLAQVSLLQRLGTQDPNQLRANAAEHPTGIEEQLAVADLDISGGHIEDAFARALDLFAAHFGKEREPIRLRLLDYFALLGAEDPRVIQARQQLANLLY